MKKLLITLTLLSFANSAMAKKLPNLDDKWLCKVEEYCYEGIIYIEHCQGLSVKLLPSGKPATCNY